jgi:hypothetical protein
LLDIGGFMKQNKYLISDYWRKKIGDNELFWGGLFDNLPICRDSVIVNPVILNSYSNQREDAWAVYHNPQSVIGFLKFIYLPTAFMGLIEEELDYQYYFQEDLGELLAELKEEKPYKLAVFEKMESFYYELNNCWREDNKSCLLNLKHWSTGFNKNWEGINGVIFSFNIFDSPIETADYIVKSYEEDLGIDFLEDDIGLTKSQFLDLAGEEIYSNEFMKRKFTDILTNKLKVTF